MWHKDNILQVLLQVLAGIYRYLQALLTGTYRYFTGTWINWRWRLLYVFMNIKIRCKKTFFLQPQHFLRLLPSPPMIYFTKFTQSLSRSSFLLKVKIITGGVHGLIPVQDWADNSFADVMRCPWSAGSLELS